MKKKEMDEIFMIFEMDEDINFLEKSYDKKQLSVEEEEVNNDNYNFCCGMPLIIDEYGYVCSICGKMQQQLLDYTSQEQFYPRILKASYSRNRHFRNILYQLQGREIFHLKDLPKIKQYIKDNEIIDLSTENVKRILKTLKLTGYYLHIQLVRKHLGCEMIMMSDELMMQLELLFNKVQQTLGEKNLPSYHFILEKLFIHLGDFRFLHLLKKLKKPQKAEELFRKVVL